jgi:hypothetical protein
MTAPKRSDPATPNPAMMAPIERLARFMAGAADDPGALFAEGPVTILDNHAPFLFAGTGAGRRWAASFLSSHPDHEDLRHVFGPAQDFTAVGDTVFLSLPTTWTWRRGGEAFHETGGWAFVLRRQAGAWRIVCSGWAVTSYTPPG